MEEFFLILKYAFLGALQGFTEPIPVSSSGHLVLAQEFLGIKTAENDFSFEILMNFASLLAVLVIYRADLLRLTQNGTKFIFKKEVTHKNDFYFILYLVLGTIPAAIIGLLFEETISNHLRGIIPIAVSLLITSVALWIIRNLKGDKNDKSLTVKDAVIVGFAQAFALIPGISRSGSTIVASMLLGMRRETALRYSFLLYIPVSLGTIVLKIDDMNIGGLFLPYLIAFFFSLVLSYFSLKWFMNVMQKGKLSYFSFYCLIIGFSIILFN